MKFSKTPRGFDLIEFVDSNDVQCSLQKSSSVLDMILFGPAPNGNAMLPTRMHLSQQQVEQLLPILALFVATGEIA